LVASDCQNIRAAAVLSLVETIESAGLNAKHDMRAKRNAGTNASSQPILAIVELMREFQRVSSKHPLPTHHRPSVFLDLGELFGAVSRIVFTQKCFCNFWSNCEYPRSLGRVGDMLTNSLQRSLAVGSDAAGGSTTSFPFSIRFSSRPAGTPGRR